MVMLLLNTKATAMRIYFDKFLDILGCDVQGGQEDTHQCPLCLNKSSLHVLDFSDGFRFYCKNCEYSGDPVQLLARLKNTTIQHALQMFGPGKEFNAALMSSDSEAQQKEYLNECKSQEDIKKYAARCRDKLIGPDGINARSKLSKEGLIQGQIPDNAGLVVGEKPFPLPLVGFRARKYTKSDHLIYFYKQAGRFTGVCTRDIDNQDAYNKIFFEPGGVYCPYDLKAPPKVLFATKNEVVTTAIASLSRHYSTLELPIVTLDELPLPHKFRNVSRVYIITNSESELTVRDAFKILSCEFPVRSKYSDVEFRVVSLRKVVPAPDELSQAAKVSTKLQSWLASELYKLYEAEGINSVVKLLNIFPDFKNREEIHKTLSGAIHAPIELLDVVTDPPPYFGHCVIARNGKAYYRREDQIMSAPGPGVPPDKIVANFAFKTLDVFQRSRDRDPIGARASCYRWYRMLIQGEGMEPVVGVVTHTELSIKAKFKQAIDQIYADNGYDFEAYLADTVPWLELRVGFNDNPGVHKPVSELGISDDLTVELPSCTIADKATKILPQFKQTNPVAANAFYAGLNFPGLDLKCDAIKELARVEYAEHSLISSVIFHFLYCVLASLVSKRDNIAIAPKHLIVVDEVPSKLNKMYEYCSRLFAGGPARNLFPPTTATNVSGIGGLPVLFTTCGGKSRIAENLQRSDYPVILFTDPANAKRINGTPNTEFAFSSHYKNPAPAHVARAVDSGLISTLRDELVAYLAEYLNINWDVDYDELVYAESPCVKAYNLAKMIQPGRQMRERINVPGIVRPYYVEKFDKIVEDFLPALGSAVYSAPRTYIVSLRDADRPVRIFDEFVAVDMASWGGISAKAKIKHKLEVISWSLQDMYAIALQGVEIPPEYGRESNLIIPRDVWDSEVKPVSRGKNVIQFSEAVEKHEAATA
jgi:hypothetical protein